MSNNTNYIPQALKNWFFAHFVIDVLFAIPLMAAPVFTLELFGWTPVDPNLIWGAMPGGKLSGDLSTRK